jgi:glycosyltransferase involved in cell wall biosynthesis
MRVGLVSTYMPPHPGGIEQVALNTFEGYRRLGVEVRWVTSRIPRALSPAAGPITRVPCCNAVEDRLGVPVPLWGWSAWRALRETCAWADVVHVIEALYIPSVMALAAAEREHKPLILCQNVGSIPYDSRALRAVQSLAWATLGKAVLRRATTVVLATPTADRFVRSLMGARLPPTAVFPVGIDTELFRPPTEGERAEARSASLPDPGRPAVLFAGRLVEKKGVPLVVEAAALSPKVEFLVAGDGPLRELLRRAAPNVRWLGHVDGSRMRQLYRAVDAALLPSKGEGLPLFVQEAMACGLPVIISDDEEYATPLIEAGLCHGTPRRAKAIAEAIPRALASPPAARLRARAFAEAQWSLDHMAARYLELIESLGKATARHDC